MRPCIAILLLTFINSSIFGQSTDSIQLPMGDRITIENPLIIDYEYGTCWGNYTFKIAINKVPNQDSLGVTIKRYLPVAYSIYTKNNKGEKIIVKDNKKLKNPYKPRIPNGRPGQYFDIKNDYLIDTSFTIVQTKLTKYLIEFEQLADSNKLELIGTNASGLYCSIRMTNGYLDKKYFFEAWYKLDDHLKKGE